MLMHHATGFVRGNIGVAAFGPIYARHGGSDLLLDESDQSRLIETPHIAGLTVDAREANGAEGGSVEHQRARNRRR